jgi:hypothetical protein
MVYMLNTQISSVWLIFSAKFSIKPLDFIENTIQNGKLRGGNSENLSFFFFCWGTHVDLIVMQRSCSSFLVSVNLVSPALAPAMIPAFDTRESVRVDFPWST